jgi:hypothetical protein
MRFNRQVAESPSLWKRFWSRFDWLDSIDVLMYGGLGLVLLGYAIYSIAGTLIRADRPFALAGFVAVVVFSAAAFVRDLRCKRLSTLSKVFASAWAVCTTLIIVIELIESFS